MTAVCPLERALPNYGKSAFEKLSLSGQPGRRRRSSAHEQDGEGPWELMDEGAEISTKQCISE
jgi:hypothetical protein